MTKKKISIPEVNIHVAAHIPTLPVHEAILAKKKLSFSFAYLDRGHKLFNLGDISNPDKVVSGKWFLDLLDCLTEVSNKDITELMTSSYELHRVGWNKANASIPERFKQSEFWQFRINKSRGRVIGVKLDNVFYIVWIDAHHNLTDSEGYGTVSKHYAPKSEYELLCEERDALKRKLEECEINLKAAEELLEAK